MLNLTDNAAGKVREALASQDDPGAFSGIRISVVGGGCSGYQYAMKLEKQAEPMDQVIAVGDFNVYVDEQSMMYLQGTRIDWVETPQGSGFKFENPNVKGTCGCGESFHA